MPKLLDPPPRLDRRPAPVPAADDHVPAPYDRDFAAPDGTACSEHDYLTRYNASAGAEYVDGRIRLLPMPSRRHQCVNKFLFRTFDDFVREELPGAEVHFAGLRVRVPDGRGGSRFREPDLLLLLDRDDPRAHDTHFDYADLCVEVVSADDPPRDTVRKRREYAAAGVREYWIVDPRDGVRTVTVLRLEAAAYFGDPAGDGGVAESVLLPGLSFPVTDCLNAV